jgi:signal transduction histidine kinase
MIEIVKINLENEMDLILAHKRSLKLAELCGISVLIQTSFATAVSEIARCVIVKDGNKSTITLGITNEKNVRKELVATVHSTVDFGKEHSNALKYATRLTGDLKVVKHKNYTEVVIIQKINFAGLINDARVESFINYFKKEPPLSPYDEIRKKNIQLLELSEKLKESENQYRILSETLPLMVFTTNATGHLTYGNKWLKDYFNLTEIQPGKLNWQSLLNNTGNTNIISEWEKSQFAQQTFSSQGKLKSRNNDEPLWHLISLIPIKNDSGQVASWTGFFVDIHAQKLVEETLKNNVELKAAQKQLLSSQAKLEDNIKELNKSNHDLEQFAYIASHDLQEPLRKIRNFTELLEKNIKDEEHCKKYLGKIDESSNRMATLIRDVLNYSRLSKTEDQFEATDLQQIFKNVLNDVELVIEEKKADVTSGKLPSIIGIPQQLHQLFYNLINNSLKFTREKPTISVTNRFLQETEISQFPDLHKSVKYIELMFKDNGIGFDQRHAKQIFTIFKRLNARGSFEGTGIGLALCKKIVDNHHGIIEATSEIGKGTTFKIILPVD